LAIAFFRLLTCGSIRHIVSESYKFSFDLCCPRLGESARLDGFAVELLLLRIEGARFVERQFEILDLALSMVELLLSEL